MISGVVAAFTNATTHFSALDLSLNMTCIREDRPESEIPSMPTSSSTCITLSICQCSCRAELATELPHNHSGGQLRTNTK